MNLRPHEINNAIKAGIFIVIALVVSGIIIFFLGSESNLFSRKNSYKAQFKNVDNLKVGGAVYLKGIKIGTVNNIEFKSIEEIIIDFSVSRDYAELIKTDSYASIKTQGMLGDKFLEIDGGSNETAAAQEDSFISSRDSSGITGMLSKSEDLLKNTNVILEKIGTFLDAINNNGNLQNTFNNINVATSVLKKSLESMNSKDMAQTMSNINQASLELQNASANINKVMGQIQKGPGSMHSLIYDNSLHEDLRTLLGGAERTQMIKYFVRESIKNKQKVDP